jgi:hypothetical protein
MKMKRYFWLMAAAVLGLVACQNKLEEVRLVDPSQVVAPVLHELPSEIVITAENMSETVKFEWDKADFGQPVQYSYSLYGSTDGGQTLVKIYSNMTDTSIEVPYESFNQVVTTAAEKGGLGLVAGQATDVTFVVGATVGSNYQTFYSNPRTVSISPTEAERVYETVWLPGTANGWSHNTAQHLFCYAEDGNTYVGVTDFGEAYADNQFKVTGAAGWADETGNWGMADPSAPAESASITLKNGSQDNITIYRAHRYYHFTFTKDNLGLKMDKGFDKVGVIGLNGDWDNDIVMTLSNNKQLFYVDIDVPSDTEFKFRLDGGWDTNWGGDMSGLTGGGGNIPVSAGQYRVYLNLNDWDHPTAKLSTSMYGKPEESEPEPDLKPKVWSLIGTLSGSSWDNDFDMTNTSGDIWVIRSVAVTANDEFKIRADHDWGTNYGGPEGNSQSTIDPSNPYEVYKPVLGEAFSGGDKNIQIGKDGSYDITFDYAAGTILIKEHVAVYSLIGEINGDSWSNDVVMTEKDGIWTSPVVTISGAFKIRYDYSWADDNTYGVEEGFTPEIGKPFTAVQPGKDIKVPSEGNYKVEFNPATKEVLIKAVAFAEQLYMIGDEFGGWNWDSDGVVEMIPVLHNPDWGAEAEGQFWTVRYISAGKGFKFNTEKKWGGDFWGLTTNEGFTESGGNCVVAEDGFYMVHVDLKREIVHVEPARIYGIGSCFGGWDEGMADALFKADGKTLKATTVAEGEVRMYAASSIATSDWWTREFVFFDGKIAYRGNGGDQERVTVLKGQEITLNFNAGTATVSGQGETPELPKNMYIVGDAVGGWDWDADYIVDMTPVNGKAGQFWAIRYIESGKGFKFCAQKAWNGDFTGLTDNSGYTVNEGNCYVSESGVYMIYVDTENKKLCVEPAKVYGIGDCFGGWSEGIETALFKADGQTLKGTTTAAGDIRLYAASSIATSDWWTREFVFFDGKIAYRGNGGDQDRVNVAAGKTVTLDFNKGTATIE